MKDYRAIIFKYFKKEKKRTLLTIIGIVLSVAMISSVFTIMDSMRKVMIKETIHGNGSYYGEFKNMDGARIDKLKKHLAVEKVGIYRELGYSVVSDIPKRNFEFSDAIPEHRYIQVIEEDRNNFDLWKHRLKEGRLPENDKEIVLEENAFIVLGDDYKIGSRVDFDLVSGMKFPNSKEEIESLGKKDYTIVGILESDMRLVYNHLTLGITNLDKIEEGSLYNTMFKTDNVVGSIEKINEIGKILSVDEEDIQTNYKLLRLSAESMNENFNASMVSMVAIIVLIIIIATVAVIYNAFNISVIERISEFGVLRAIGMKKIELLNLVLLEALILVLIAMPLGLVSGFLAMHIVFNIVGNVGSQIYFINNLRVEPNIFIVGFTVILAVITVLLSAIIPAMKASNVSAIDAIRNSGEIRKEKIRRKKSSFFLKKIFGFEGEIAYKNLSRNKSRFLITVFSMTISIILLVTFSSFTENIYKITGIERQNVEDFIIIGNESIESTEMLMDEIEKIEGVENVYIQTETTGLSSLDKGKIRGDYLDNFLDNIQIYNDNLEVQSTISYIGDDRLEKLSGLKLDDLNRENAVILFNNTKILTKNKVEDNIRPYNFKSGDKIKIKLDDDRTEELEIIGFIEGNLEGVDKKHNGRLMLFTSRNNMEKLSAGNLDQLVKIETADNLDRTKVLKQLDKLELDYNLTYVDMETMNKEENIMKIVTNIFLYGFISLIALISSINIINTISTNIILRTREIAILKAIGMKSKDIEKMVALEGIYYSFYAIFFGVLVSIPLTYSLYKSMVGISLFSYSLPFKGIAIAVVGTFTISLISGIYPLKKINEKIIVENIRN